jgi:methylated-DNA-[protein]-cysteine S-methyltransferase
MLAMDFSSLVKEIVRNIPKGSTLSYKEVAKRAGNPRAARAVARIMASNYNPNIPCHRVIRSDGTLGGYNRGGEKQKRVILKSESN